MTNTDTNSPVYYDYNYQSYIITDSKIIKEILKSSNFSSDRLKVKLEALDNLIYPKKQLEDFYSNWLMYMDDEKHHIMRNETTNFLSEISLVCIESEIKKIIEDYILESKNHFNRESDIEKLSNMITNKVMSEIIGVSESTYIKLIEISRGFTEFLYLQEVSEKDIEKTIISIERTKNYLIKIFESTKINSNSILGKMQKNSTFSNEVIINILVDGHDPLKSTIMSLFYYATQTKLTDFKNDYQKILSNFAPFTYCSRIALQDYKLQNNIEIKAGEWVICILPTTNGCPFNHTETILAFGFGRHRCIGSAISTKIIKYIYSYLEEIQNKQTISLVSSYEKNGFGFFSFDKLIIKFEDLLRQEGSVNARFIKENGIGHGKRLT